MEERVLTNKFYEDQSSFAQRNNLETEEDFTKKIISLKRAPTEDYCDTPYQEALELSNTKGISIWQRHREKKILLNRSQEQLQRSVKKWGTNKSVHHERSLMVADRHKIIYNNHERSFKRKPNSPSKDNLSNSLFMNQDKFLSDDNESLTSSDEDDFRRKTRNMNKDYSFNESNESNSNAKVHDLSYNMNDQDSAIDYYNTSI